MSEKIFLQEASVTIEKIAEPLCNAIIFPQEIGLDERIHIAIQHRIHITDLEIRPMILDQAVGLEDIGADLAAPGDPFLVTVQVFIGLRLFLATQFIKTGCQHLHGSLLIAMLGSFILALHDNAGRQMGNPNGRIGLVDMLPTGAAGSVSINPQVFIDNVNLDGIVKLGHDHDRRKEVRRRPLASKGEIRTRRWIPTSERR